MWPTSARWRAVIDTVELLPSLVRSERRRRGLTIREAADEMGYSYADLCRFELGGKQPALPSILKMLKWLSKSERVR